MLVVFRQAIEDLAQTRFVDIQQTNVRAIGGR
jgi:hypothetical protein